MVYITSILFVLIFTFYSFQFDCLDVLLMFCLTFHNLLSVSPCFFQSYFLLHGFKRN